MEPLETIGPLSLLRDQLDEPFLVLNGDVLLNLNQFVSSHRRSISTLDRQVDPPDQDGLWRDRRYGRTRQRFSAKSPSSRISSARESTAWPVYRRADPVRRPLRV
jgi:NDP-sugar pyrophosphorylase family protein